MEEKSAEDRIKGFLEAYGKLVEEYKVDMANYPMWQPNQDGTWHTVIQSTAIDIKDRAVKSPFIAKE